MWLEGSCMTGRIPHIWRAMAARRIRLLGDPSLRIRYTDMKGKVVTMDLEGPMAELLQHELDHLDGILALDQPSGLDPFAYRAEWEKHHKPAERYGPPRPREV